MRPASSFVQTSTYAHDRGFFHTPNILSVIKEEYDDIEDIENDHHGEDNVNNPLNHHDHSDSDDCGGESNEGNSDGDRDVVGDPNTAEKSKSEEQSESEFAVDGYSKNKGKIYLVRNLSLIEQYYILVIIN